MVSNILCEALFKEIQQREWERKEYLKTLENNQKPLGIKIREQIIKGAHKHLTTKKLCR